MKKYVVFIFLAGLIVSGCATTNTTSNRDILMAITRQTEAISNLATAVRSPAPAPITPTVNPVKKTGTGFGHSLTEADLYPEKSNSRSKPDRTLISEKSDNDTDHRFARLEKRVHTLERIELKQNKRLDALENARRKLTWEIGQVGIDSFPGITVGKFAHGSAKVSWEIENQIKAVAEKYNAASAEKSGKIEVVVTGFNDKGGISEKRGTAVLKVLKKYLNKKFEVKYTGSDDTAEISLNGKAFISNPFKTAS